MTQTFWVTLIRFYFGEDDSSRIPKLPIRASLTRSGDIGSDLDPTEYIIIDVIH